MKKNYVKVLGGLAIILSNFHALAQEQAERTLNEVVVTASRSPRKQSEIGRVIRVIGAKQLAQSQGRTLPEVLNNVAGLQLSGAGNAFGSNISVFTRGASAGNTLILIDGVPVNNASGISGEYDISAFAIDQIERVEILRGVNSTLYGSDAVAGVINIITKHPKENKLEADVLGTAGNYNSHKEAIGLNGNINKTGIALNFANTSTKGFSVSNDKAGTAGFDRDGFKQLSFNTRLNQQFTNRFSASANLQLTQNRFDLDGGAFDDDMNYTGKNSFLFGGVNFKYRTGNSGELSLNVNQNNVNNTYNNLLDGKSSSRVDNKGKITYSELIWTSPLVKGLDITSGLNYRTQKSDQLFESTSDFGPYNSYISSDTAHNNIFSGFTNLFLKTDAGFNFELGGRYNHHSVYGNNYTYTVNPSFVIAERYKIFASVASAYKVPSIYQLYSQYGTLKLKPEKSTSYEGGVDLEFVPSKVTFTATGFVRDINDLIYFYTDPKTFVSVYRNGNKQNDRGFEFELNTKPLNKLGFNAWYAFVKGEGKQFDGTKLVKTEFLHRRPKTSFGANTNINLTKALSWSIIYKYTGKRTDPVFNTTTFKTDILTHASYHIFDTYLQLNATDKLTLFADLKNLFNTEFVEWEGYNVKGFNFNAGLKYQIK